MIHRPNFQLHTADGRTINVRLNNPLDENAAVRHLDFLVASYQDDTEWGQGHVIIEAVIFDGLHIVHTASL